MDNETEIETIDECLETFNECFKTFTEMMSQACPDSIISNYKKEIIGLINNSPTKIIEIFIIYVLPHKAEIDSGKDEYFLDDSFKEKSGIDNGYIGKIFEFRDIWKSLTDNNKEVVRVMIQGLSNLAQQYFSFKYSL